MTYRRTCLRFSLLSACGGKLIQTKYPWPRRIGFAEAVQPAPQPAGAAPAHRVRLLEWKGSDGQACLKNMLRLRDSSKMT